MEYGITEKGFNPKPLAVCRKEAEDKLKGELGDDINTLPEAVFGQLLDIYAEREADIWLKMEAEYLAISPSGAKGVALDIVNAIRGVYRNEKTRSIITTQALIGAYNSNIPAGTRFAVEGNPTSEFVTVKECLLDHGADESQLISFSSLPDLGGFQLELDGYQSGVITFISTADDVKGAIEEIMTVNEVTVTGDYSSGFFVTFVNQDGKQPWDLLEVYSNNLQYSSTPITIDVTRSQAGLYQATTEMVAVDYGSSFYAEKGTLTKIVSPVNGLEYTTNMVSADVGLDFEEDEDFRIRGEQSLGIAGSATTHAIASAIADIGQEIEYVKVFENRTSSVVNGWDPHSIAVYVHQTGGSTQKDKEIAYAIDSRRAGGIGTNGDVTYNLYDSQGYLNPVKFYRAVEVEIYLEISLTKIQGVYPSDGDDALKSLIVENGNRLGVGNDVVVYPTLMGWISQIAGISNVAVKIGSSPSLTSDLNVPISDGSSGTAEFSSWDATRITIL